jgi:hypothetical protein
MLIKPSQQEVFTTESHPPPSSTVHQGCSRNNQVQTREYKEGDIVWMWDTKKGEPTNVKGKCTILAWTLQSWKKVSR